VFWSNILVIFEKITYRNFLSVGNSPIEIALNKNKTTLLTAENGRGKSTFIDSLCFCLYNRAYRNITKPQLVNSINQKNCLVEVWFSIGKNKYKVSRGIKPAIFEIYENGKLVNQDPNSKDYQKVLEQQYLKMNYRAFTQVVVMGSAAYVPFMKLSTSHRRDFIEDLLDIKVFSVMNKILSQMIKDSKDKLKEFDFELQSTKDMLKVVESHVAIKKDSVKSDILAINLTISDLMKENDEYIKNIDSISDDLSVVQSQYNNLIELKEKQNQLERIKLDLDKKKNAILEEQGHTKETTICHNCESVLSDAAKNKVMLAIENKLTTCNDGISKLLIKLSDLNIKLINFDSVEVKLKEYNHKIQEINTRIYGNRILIQQKNKELSKLEKIDLSDDSEVLKLASLAKKILELTVNKTAHLDKQQIENVCSVLLQDSGIKSKVIKQYIPLINKMVNKYLTQLDFFVSFNLDESFSESIKSRHRDIFSYDSFSQGEKQRIDLSLLFSWRDLARAKNSINTNLIVMDEIFDAQLDHDGFNAAIALINSMSDSNVFVVSHRDSIADKFDATIKLIKKNNFTEIV
jgi:DNA repair exonuclease SbcCD ATPase subunit